MFFEKEMLMIRVLDVFELNQKNINNFNSRRNFNALSFRFRADTIIKTLNTEDHLSDNSICYFPAGLEYARISAFDKLIVIHFDITDFYTQSIEYFAPKDPEPFARLFREILDTWNQQELGYKYKCSALLYRILSECYTQNYKGKTNTSRISGSVEYIMKNYKNSTLSIGEIAGKSFMSEVYFRKLFKAEYGISPQKFIMNLRIQNAAGLISTGYYSLKEVAYMSGYNDYKYFSVEFKRIMGTSPSKYCCNSNKF